MTGGGQRLDLVLDGGRVGLRFFAEHLPRAERCAPGLPSCAQLRERYDEQRGTDPAVLLADADVFARLEGALGAEVARQRSYVDALAAAWTGGGAVGAADALDRHVAVGEDLQARLGAARRALTDAAAAVLAIVEEKSRAAAEFADTTVGGRTVEEIDAILAGAAGGDGPTTAQLAAWDSALGPAPVRAAVTQWCGRWRDEVFRPGVETAVESFLDLCDDTDRAVRAVLAELAATLAPPDPGPRSVAPMTDPWSPCGAATDLVAAGLRLATAVGELTGAVLGLATTVVEEVSEAVEPAGPPQPQPERPLSPPPDPAHPPSRTPAPETPAPAAGGTGTDPDTPGAGPGDDTPPAPPDEPRRPDEPGDGGALGPAPPDEPRRPDEPGDGGALGPAPAGMPGTRADTPARRPASAVPAGESVEAGPEEEPADGVVLAEAGPL
ncbi:hypothetical protein ACWEQV_28320 [Rhodococcus aetherivorans]|uniref:hypothetical protein n=1 Tax=Rhodococcus aetherivorans TaxID=191292 RepID=UPI0003E20BF1|nr:hypothetical protein [Rhodococcus aetherivorans]ETT23508.1 hypothetical protein RR21198_5389 [Rhodococcus rhodochrous ATCC 21198]KDE12801.1 hypothetical protein N505_0115295 [Rhodococcus aetherivorans]MDV6296618.1 hypothetical protein [Rhodococcus aetherivorans]